MAAENDRSFFLPGLVLILGSIMIVTAVVAVIALYTFIREPALLQAIALQRFR